MFLIFNYISKEMGVMFLEEEDFDEMFDSRILVYEDIVDFLGLWYF